MSNRYRSKPQEVEAIQWTGGDADGLFQWVGQQRLRFAGTGYETLELLAGKDGAQGWVPVPVGHWIVRKPNDTSDYWPVDNDYFAEKYEAVDDE